MPTIETFYYAVPVIMVLAAVIHHSRSKLRRTAEGLAVARESEAAGLTEPPSLHPVVDLGVCIGSGACVRACPEQALGIIKGKGVLINPTHCIGHGACAPACPVGAIKLVFGTAKRGMDIPAVTPDFETNVPGLFIAGELGGMGLIRNAVRQGVHAIQAIAARPRGAAAYDVVIVGAGPAGIAASLAAKAAKLRYVTLEQEDSVGGTTYHYPRRKLVMTVPMKLPYFGEIPSREISKETLMEIWQRVLQKATLKIRFREKMEEIAPQPGGGFVVRSRAGQYAANHVLLCIGRRGTPRKLGVPGEEQPKVVYRLIDAEQYKGQHVVVVGGGDSALEAALDLAEQPGTKVTLSCRDKVFDRAKPKNRDRVAAAAAARKLVQAMESSVQEIGETKIVIKTPDGPLTLRNDAVIVCAGGELPTPMLKKIGVQVDVRYGT
jgi:thioredoxin reductase/NAD-dependent dihydropyrimidine dehydrogenase PreA subunit